MKLNKPFHIFFVFLLLVAESISFGQEPSVHPFPMDEKSLLWQIDGPNVKKKCYLFGTMHIIPNESFYFPKKLKKVLGKSEQITMEMAGVPDEAEIMELIMLKEGTLFNFFDSLQLDSLYAWGDTRMGLNKEMFIGVFSQMKPVAVIQMATQLRFGEDLSSYELTLQTIAEDKNLVISGLETIEMQLSLFDDLSTTDQADLVMESIREDDAALNENDELITCYLSQDIDALYELITEGGDVISEHQSSFLDDRNKDWIPKITAMITTKKTFIAVGAGHLGGPNGVVRLLEKEGYTLTPIKL